MKKIILSNLIIFFIITTSVNAWSVNTFNNSLDGENLTFTGNGNFTRWLEIPEDTFVVNASLYLNGHYIKIDNSDISTFSSVTTYNIDSSSKRGGIYLKNLNNINLKKISFAIYSLSSSPVGSFFIRFRNITDDSIIYSKEGGIIPTQNWGYVTFDISDSPTINSPIYINLENNLTSGSFLFALTSTGGSNPSDDKFLNLSFYDGTSYTEFYGLTGSSHRPIKLIFSYGKNLYPINSSLWINNISIWNGTNTQIGTIKEYTELNYSLSNSTDQKDLWFNDSNWFILDNGGNQIDIYDESFNYIESKSLSTQPEGMFYNDSLEIWYVIDGGDKIVREYYKNWTSNGITYDLSSSLDSPRDLYFYNNTWFIIDRQYDKILKYDSSFNNLNINYSISSEDTDPRGLFYTDDFWYIVGSQTNTIYQYNKSFVYTGKNLNISQQTTDPEGLFDDGINWWIVGNTPDYVFQYNRGSGGYESKEIINNFVSILNNYLDSCSIVSGYCNVPFIFHSDTAGILEYSTLEFRDDIIITNSQTYNSTAIETSTQSFSSNITYSSSNWNSIVGILTYNNTNYTATESGSGNNLLFTYSLNVPSVSSDTNLSFYWTYALTNETGTFYTLTAPINQTIEDVTDFIVTNSSCGAGYFEAINYTFAIANNLTSLNMDVAYNFKYGIGDLTAKQIYGSINNVSVLRVCINETFNNYKLGYGEIDYDSSNYIERRFYMFNGFELSNSTTQSYTLYTLNNADATSFIFEIQDTSLDPISGSYLNLWRWYPELNEYKIVEAAITDEDGLTVMKVETEDVDYKVGVYYPNGTLIYLTDSARMACLVDPCTYTILIPTTSTNYFVVNGIQHSLTWDETNKRFIFTWSDPSQVTTAMRLYVYKDAGFQNIEVCNTTSASYSGTITCSVGNLTGNFFAEVYRSASPEQSFISLWSTTRTTVQSSFGLFLGFLLALTAGLIGVFSPVVAIVMILIGLVPVVIFGSINMAIFMGIVALAGIIIHYLRKM